MSGFRFRLGVFRRTTLLQKLLEKRSVESLLLDKQGALAVRITG
ncbi:hypothetical protein [Pseudomonas sp. LP_7_YM]|nr:hypothetical protein [Pseudomonas sp. LP_7_YM]TDV72813.1 hypothetical protein EC915_101961 [Pseudomonas sp. LP_7_YM]